VDYSVQFYLNEKKLPCAEETKRRRGEEEKRKMERTDSSLIEAA